MCPYMEESAGIFRYCVSQSSDCLAVVTGQQSSVAYCQSDDLSSSVATVPNYHHHLVRTKSAHSP